MKRVIAIDGPSGAGKSTVAKAVAEALGFRYLDTGALYRAVGLGLLRAGLDEHSTDGQLADALRVMDVALDNGRVLLNGEDVSEAIRTTEAGHYSSVFSARRPVREYLMPVQRDAAERADLVAEGRDMGSVVFPGAWRKYYLDATVEARARRRFDQLAAKGKPISMAEAERDVVERDRRDSGRDIAPLKRADGAVSIDSSAMGADEVIKAIIAGAKGT